LDEEIGNRILNPQLHEPAQRSRTGLRILATLLAKPVRNSLLEIDLNMFVPEHPRCFVEK
jgi:hypothetical protein